MKPEISNPNQEENTNPHTRLIPLTRWNDYHPFPTVPALRWMRFNGDKTGFNRCTLKVGKRVLIDEAKFFNWLREFGQEGS
jgi:hypothetical protein